jgi:NAD(P)-dependent dehydrogenase (short-subunit alcohol dehydrogenase family)
MKTFSPQAQLLNKLAIVTGAARGIGFAIAKKFAHAGAIVYLCDINENLLNQALGKLETEGSRVHGVKLDVTNKSDVKKSIEKIAKTHGRIDILVNNAGILKSTRFHNIEKEEWDKILDVNINGVFLPMKEVIKHMMLQNYGRIVNMSSSAGRSVSTLGGAHYTTSKAAVLGLTRAVAKEMGKYNITVNAICPGLIDTEMARTFSTPEELKRYEESFPITRLGTPEEVANLALFLASDNSAYISGASLDINGGDLML